MEDFIAAVCTTLIPAPSSVASYDGLMPPLASFVRDYPGEPVPER